MKRTAAAALAAAPLEGDGDGMKPPSEREALQLLVGDKKLEGMSRNRGRHARQPHGACRHQHQRGEAPASAQAGGSWDKSYQEKTKRCPTEVSALHPLRPEDSPAHLPTPVGSQQHTEGYNDVPGTEPEPVGPETLVEREEALALPRLGERRTAQQGYALPVSPGPSAISLPFTGLQVADRPWREVECELSLRVYQPNQTAALTEVCPGGLGAA